MSELANVLRETTEAMASFASVDMALWDRHSNACLQAAAALSSAEEKAVEFPRTQEYVDRLIRIFRDRPDDDTSAVVLHDYARAALPLVSYTKVEALNWVEHAHSFPAPTWSARTPFGFYNIDEVSASDCPRYEVRLHAHKIIAVVDGLIEAKAAAQQDYETRIRSAICGGDGDV